MHSASAGFYPITEVEPEAPRRELVKRQDETCILVTHVEPPDPVEPRLTMLSDPSSDRARAFRLLRQRLIAGGDPRSILVTSAEQGEGKTTCASNLALAIAEEARVLLLDAHRERAALGDMFGLDGMPVVLSGALLHAYPVAELNATRLALAVLERANGKNLDRSLLSVALGDLGTAYDYLVIDAGSILEGVDAQVLGGMSEAVLLAVREGRSSRREIDRALRQLAPARPLGAVLLGS